MLEFNWLVLSKEINWHNPQGGGGTLIYAYIRRLGRFFVFKILNFISFGFQKNE